MSTQLRFRALDGWRGVCALLVVLLHVPIKTTLISLPFFSNAWLFVDFFFVLSGFVIAHAYGTRLVTVSNVAMFVIKRFGRLWPLHVIILGCLVVMELARLALLTWYGTVSQAPFTGDKSVPLILQNVLLLQAIRPEPLLSWNGPSWSISVEFWTYILFAMITFSAVRHSNAIKILIAVASCALIYTYSTLGMNVNAWQGFFRCFFGFFAGQLLYRFYISSASMSWQSRWTTGTATILEGISILCVIVFVSVVRQSAYSIAAPILFAGAVYVFAPEKGVISRLMTTHPFNRLGRYSYSIYMVHMLVIVGVMALIRLTGRLIHVPLILKEKTLIGDYADLVDFGGNFTMLCLTTAVVVVVVLMSWMTWLFVERPGQMFFGSLAMKVEAYIDRALQVRRQAYHAVEVITPAGSLSPAIVPPDDPLAS